MDECIFCKIVKKEIPSHAVYEDEHSYAFLDINPVHAGHTLVIPKQHSTNLFDITAHDWAEVAETVRTVASAVEKATDASGVNLMMNNREVAGQVVDHTHVHVIPRHKGDGLKLWPQRQYKESEAEEILKKIVAAL